MLSTRTALEGMLFWKSTTPLPNPATPAATQTTSTVRQTAQVARQVLNNSPTTVTTYEG